MRWENSIDIFRSVPDVFDFVTDANGGTRWHRANIITPISPEPIRLGSTYRVSGKFLFWHLDSVSEVTKYELNRLVTYRSDAGMYTYELRYILEPIPGGTRFTEIGEADPKGFLRLMIKLIMGGANQNSLQGLKMLKDILEMQK